MRAWEDLAADFLRRGKSHSWIHAATGLSVTRIEAIARDLERPCADPARCGHPQVGAGHPRRGWINVRDTGGKGAWCCSWSCVAAFANRRLLKAAM